MFDPAARRALLSAGLLAVASRARGAEAERIALEYDAPAECPSAAVFHDEVRSRVNGDWEAAPGEPARRIGVKVARRGERYVAAIEFRNPEGDDVTRSVAGQKCDDVVNGIALVTALAIESRVEEAMAQSEPAPASEPPAAPGPKPAASTPRAAAASPAGQALPSAPVAAPAPRAASPAARASRRTHVRFGAASVTSTGVGPDAAFGPELFAVVELSGLRFGVSGTALWSGLVHADGVAARFRRLTVRLDGCPFVIGRALSFEPCAFAEAGSLHGEGETNARLVNAEGGSSLWAAPGLLARLLGRVDPVVVSLELDGGVPLSRQRFGVVTDGSHESSFKVPPLIFGGDLGVGLRL